MMDFAQALKNTEETLTICEEVLAHSRDYEPGHVKMVRQAKRDAINRAANLRDMITAAEESRG